MTTYTCVPCSYTTNRLDNYNRHLSLKKHIDKVQGVLKHYCHTCKIQFSSGASYGVHKIKFHQTPTQSNTITTTVQPTTQPILPKPQKIPIKIKPLQQSQQFIEVNDFVKLFPDKKISTIQRYFYDICSYFPNNDSTKKTIPIQWKSILIDNAHLLEKHAQTLNPNRSKGFLKAVNDLIPEIKNIVVIPLSNAQAAENIHSKKKRLLTNPSSEFKKVLLDIITSLYQYPFRRMELFTAYVKKPLSTLDLQGKNFYDVNTGIFHINDDKVSKFYDQSTILFNPKLINDLNKWFTNLNHTDFFLLSLKGQQLNNSSFNYILCKLGIKATVGRKLYANNTLDNPTESAQVLRHNLNTHFISYVT